MNSDLEKMIKDSSKWGYMIIIGHDAQTESSLFANIFISDLISVRDILWRFFDDFTNVIYRSGPWVSVNKIT